MTNTANVKIMTVDSKYCTHPHKSLYRARIPSHAFTELNKNVDEARVCFSMYCYLLTHHFRVPTFSDLFFYVSLVTRMEFEYFH